MRTVVHLGDSKEEVTAYAAGIRMASEIFEWRISTLPWWMKPFAAFEATNAIKSLRCGADIIEGNAEQATGSLNERKDVGDD